MLQTDARLNAVTLARRTATPLGGQWDVSVLRTLQRRMCLWSAMFGAEREVYFAQEHPPGRQGVALAHRLYQFALAYSGWRHVNVMASG